AGNDTNDEDYPMIVIVSAGPDRTFQTTCDAYSGTGLTKGGDDIVMDYTYETASASVDGLWRIKSGEPDTAEIDKQLFVSGGARFTSAINLTAPSAQLQLGAASMLFPTQADLATCNAANNQLLRVNTATAPITLEICDFANGGWQSVSAGAGSIWQLGAGDDIYYSSGTTPQVGIGNNSPTEALDVTGNIQLSGNVAFSSAGSRVGWSSGADITESAGDLLIDANGGSGVEVTVGADSLDIAGDTVITGTTSGVTTIDALTVENVLGTDILNVQNNGNVGIGVADPTERLDVGGSITATDHYKLDGTNILTDNSAAGTVLLGKSAGSLTSGNYNTILGSGAAGTLSTGTGNIIVGSGATAPDVPAGATSNYLNIGDLIYGDIAGNRVGINQAAGVDVTTFDDTLEVAGTIDASGNINSDATVIGANVTTTGRVTTNELYVQNTDNFIPGNCAAGSFHRWDGNSWECEADTGGVGGGTQDLDSVLTQGSDANFQSAGNFSGIAIGSNTFSTGAQTLELDVTGDVGATYYCDAAGNNCFTAA
ncbi:MAG TPA: hypothetical protein DEA55_06605, partial [Rhodospirillaceae bacterium]|nr:hypothetical protein [Rhodospirillaceae bacterium]